MPLFQNKDSDDDTSSDSASTTGSQNTNTTIANGHNKPFSTNTKINQTTMSVRQGSRNYDPTTEEFNAAVTALMDRKKGDWRDIQAQIKKDNPTWKVPDRRTTKFVKRAKAGDPITDADDEKSVMSHQGAYTPTNEEFGAAIDQVYERDHSFNWRDVQKSVKRHHPAWKVPYKRVSAFVKAKKAGAAYPTGDDDKSVSSLRSSSKEENVVHEPTAEAILVKDLSISWKVANEKVIAAKSELGEDADRDTVVAHVKDMEAAKDAPIKSVATDETAESEEAYKDDNDGKKEKGCLCVF